MSQTDTLFQRITACRSNFSAKQNKLADYIIHHYQTVAFLNSTDLAKAAGVSGSTVIRFAEAVGYEGFPKLKAALHAMIKQDINTVDAFMEHQPLADSHSLFQPCIDTFYAIERHISAQSLDETAALLAKARHLYIVGFQGTAFLAEYMSYYLAKVRRNVHLINKQDSNLFAQLSAAPPEENAALIYAFPRFPVLTRKMAHFFHDHKTPIACLSTLAPNEISCLADIVIPIDIEYRAYIDHLAPVVYLSEVLGKKIADLNHAESIRQLKAFEHYAENTHIFCTQQPE